jgi:2,4-diaminopentanoate dehydrogenase
MTSKPIRVVQWATGNCGERSLREVIRDPRFELVGVLTFSSEKAGRDAGELCGEPATGIKATMDVEEIFGLAADCVIYVPRATGSAERRVGTSVDEVCEQAVRFAQAGTNIVTTLGDFFDDGRANFTAVQRDRIEAACARGSSTIFASGGDPGWFTEMLPLPFLANMRRIDYIELEEFGDLSRRPSPHMLFNQMQFGRSLEEYDAQHRKSVLYTVYQPTVAVTAKLAGFEIDDWACDWEVATARIDCEPVAGPLKAGQTAAQKLVITGSVKGVPRIRFIQYGYMSRDLVPDWNLGPLGWRMTFDGDAPVKVDIPWQVDPAEIGSFVPSFNTNHLVNAIPYLHDAPNGIVTAAELPAILPSGPYGKSVRVPAPR